MKEFMESYQLYESKETVNQVQELICFPNS